MGLGMELRRDLFTTALVLAVSAGLMVWLPRSEPKPCNGPAQTLFWNCVR
jgi:hypothetical protein